MSRASLFVSCAYCGGVSFELTAEGARRCFLCGTVARDSGLVVSPGHEPHLDLALDDPNTREE
jgi:hypothetical protein